MNRRVRLIFTAVIFFTFISVSLGQAAGKAKMIKSTTVSKQVEGEISGISVNFISVIYARDVNKGIDYEMMLPLDKSGLTLEHRKSLKELQVGDRVNVAYDEMEDLYSDGKKEVKTKGRKITFLKPAEKKMIPQEEEVLGDQELAIKDLRSE